MNKIPRLYILSFLLLGIAGCRTVHKITSKDNSTSSNNRKKNTRKTVFIDGIEITPGSVVKSKHKPATTKTKIGDIEIPTNLPKTSNVEVEKVKPIQIKYALLLDTYVESITNIDLFNKIDEWWGTSYCLGGTTKSCIDCSSFTGTIIREIYKINLPRTAAEQRDASNKINKEDLKEGDLVFFRTKRGYINHVGIYLTNNKFVHASTSSGVIISDLNENYWQGKFAGGGRVVN
ncbi:MAG: C40 family peptidase [Chitinophagaceae bacterium]